MVSITPQGQIYLCKTPLENDYRNQLTFSNATNQLNYFNNKVFKTFNDYTYIKHDNIIKVGANIDEIINCNYLFYRNNEFTNKWYYCFITNMEYVNENCTLITFETDVWQTYQFNLTYNPCFIEREHVNDDTIGLNIVPENLDIGDPITYSKEELYDDTTRFRVCFAVTEGPDSTIASGMQKNMGGIYGGLYYFCAESFEDADKIIKIYDLNSRADAIVSVFMIPSYFTEFETYNWIYHEDQADEIKAEVRYVNNIDESQSIGSVEIELPSKIGNYTPHNKKLLTFPFTYCNATNNAGTTIPFKFEDSSYINDLTNKKEIFFMVEGVLTQGISAKAIPYDYKNIAKNYMEGITIGKFPICSWNSDYYLNWETLNAVNTVANGIESIIPAIADSAVNGASGFLGVFGAIYNTMHQFTVAKLTPDQARGNINSGDINFSYQNSGGFSLYLMGIKEQTAKIIDKYFDLFGYKVNAVKVPNITGRTNWNYVKTIDCNFEGDIPQQHLQKIKNIFNEGITLWHNPTTMYDYSQSNNIVS